MRSFARQPGRIRLAALGAFATTCTLIASLAIPLASAAPKADPEWQVGELRLETPWTDEVSPTNALPEYPRPQLTRPRWKNLNGVWEFAAATADEAPPLGQQLDERVLVPYPIESALSGIQRHEDYMWYRRTIQVPHDWGIGEESRLKLHFGAVDYRTTVWVNGEQVAEHAGGYDAFTADITEAVTGDGPQEVVVGVEDRTEATFQPVGKQRLQPRPGGIFYTSASGIWQTVWMEPVAATGHVEQLNMTPDLDAETLRLEAETAGNATGVRVVVRDDGQVVSRTEGPADEAFAVPVPDPKLWSPDSPHLYDLDVRLLGGGGVIDRVGSYFGMREIGMKRGADGRLRMTLNGKVLFQMSTLDQGYWPDGIYTAPTDEALAFDLKEHKRLGFNTVRKHIKTEPDRWYYHADRLGLLVWQDMPSMRLNGTPSLADRQQFESELHEIVDEKKDWTSIIGWVPFNEGWGEWDRQATARIAQDVKAQDPSRLVNAHSGFNCCRSLGDPGTGDVIDWHRYTDPAQPPPEANRVSMDGEHGGFGLEIEGHMWFGEGEAYRMLPDRQTLTEFYVANQQQVLNAAQRCGISGAIYTQWTDLEGEVNGIYTYDRRVEKMDAAQVRQINERIVREADGTGVSPPEPDPGAPGLEGTHAYAFDEGAGTTAADSVGDADATLVNATWAPGVDGTAVSFSGNGEANTGQHLVRTTTSFSVSAWAKVDTAGSQFQTVVSQDAGSSSSFILQYSGNTRTWGLSVARSPLARSTETVEAGRWYHLTGVYDARVETATLYVDGTKQATQSACNANETSGNTIIGRGENRASGVDFLQGDVDDVRIFDRALSDAEVAELATR